MFDLGWLEILIIGITALIVVGPKDLPMMFRTIGRFIGKAKGMAREFSQSMEDAADESGVRDATKTLNSISEMVNVKKFTKDKLSEELIGSDNILNAGAPPVRKDKNSKKDKLKSSKRKQKISLGEGNPELKKFGNAKKKVLKNTPLGKVEK
jgi:sec-independent protein translocase protein TatB